MVPGIVLLEAQLYCRDVSCYRGAGVRAPSRRFMYAEQPTRRTLDDELCFFSSNNIQEIDISGPF